MRINITDGYETLESFKELFNISSNVKDVYLLCHQAGCPVYVIRDVENKCAIMWHPHIDNSVDVLTINISEGILRLVYEGRLQEFQKLDELKRAWVYEHIIGDNPFDNNYLVWSRN